MGLGNFLMKRSMYVTPGVHMRQLKAHPDFDEAWLQDHLFRDLVVCLGQLAKTELDLCRVGSRGYMKKVSYGKYTIKDKPVRQLFEAMEIDASRLEEEGYISNTIRKLIDAVAAANRHDKDSAAAAQNSLYAISLVLARYIIDLHPEYNDRIKQCGNAVRECAK